MSAPTMQYPFVVTRLAAGSHSIFSKNPQRRPRIAGDHAVRSLLPSLLLFTASAVGADEKVTFVDHVLPVFEQTCLNCHNPDKTKGGLDLSNYNATLRGGSGGKIVEPGDEGSRLIGVVEHSIEPSMPPEGDPIASAQIDILRAWIEGGLLQHAGSKARKPDKPKFDTAMKADPLARPEGPPPMPELPLLEPEVVAERPSAVHAMAMSPWAPLLAVTGQRQVLLFDTEKRRLAGILPFPEGTPVSLAFTPNARYLIVGGGVQGKSGLTVTFDVVTGERALTAAKEYDTVLCADLRPDLGTIATGSPSRLIKLWKTADGSRINSIKQHTEWVTALDYSPDGILLATGDRNGGARVWEGATGNEFHNLRGHQGGITALAFRGDSNMLATASQDGTLRFWEMTRGREVKKINAHNGGVLAFDWARDGSSASAGRDRKVRVWKPDFGGGATIEGLPDIPTALAFDGEGQRVYVADYQGAIHIYHAESGDKLGELEANPPAIDTRLAELEKALEQHPAAVEKAEEAVISARDAVQSHKDRIASHASEIRATEKSLKEVAAEMEKARRISERKADQLPPLRKRVEEAAAETATLAEKLDAKRAELESARRERKTRRSDAEAARRQLETDDLGENETREAREIVASFESQEKLVTRLAEEVSGRESARREAMDRRKELEDQREELEAARRASAARAEELASRRKAREQRLPELRAALEKARKPLGPARKKHAQAKRELEALETRETRLREDLAYWRRGRLSSGSVRAKARAGTLSGEARELHAAFTAAAKSIEDLEAELTARRTERERFRRLLEAPADAEVRIEQQAVLGTLDALIGDLAGRLRERGTRVSRKAAALDGVLPEIDALERRAAELRRRYRAAIDHEG